MKQSLIIFCTKISLAQEIRDSTKKKEEVQNQGKKSYGGKQETVQHDDKDAGGQRSACAAENKWHSFKRNLCVVSGASTQGLRGGVSSPLIAPSHNTCRTNTPLEEISRRTADMSIDSCHCFPAITKWSAFEQWLNYRPHGLIFPYNTMKLVTLSLLLNPPTLSTKAAS